MCTDRLRSMVAIMVLSACGSEDTAGQDVVVRTDPASAAECAHGGSVLSSGLDENRNQALDDVEIRTRTVVCNDAPAPPIVVRLVAEPPGVHCTQGGTAVQSGPDRNGDGHLDPDEVTHTDYVCGEPLLTRFATEPPGAHCVAGGIVFFVGRDRNADSQLADAEIEHTEYECSEILSRDVVIQTADDVAALANIRVINGVLTIDETRLDDLVLPQLGHVRNLVVTDNPLLVRLRLPALTDTEGFVLLVGNTALTSLQMPSLRHVGTDFVVRDNPALGDLFGVASPLISGDLQISRNVSLVSLGNLSANVGPNIIITDNPALQEVHWTSFASFASVGIARNGITTLTLRAEVLAPEPFGNVAIFDNAQLAHASIDSDGMNGLLVRNNTALSELLVNGRGVEHDVTISENGQLNRVVFDGLDSEGFKIRGSLFLSAPIDAFFSFQPIVVDGDCTFEGTQLTMLDGRDGIRHVGGTFTAAHNPLLTNIEFFTVSGGITLIGNAVLGIARFELLGVSTLAYTGSIIVKDNPQLEFAELLDLVTAVRGHVIIENNANLLRVSSAITDVGGNIQIRDNPKMNFLGFPSLHTVGALDVSGNASLLIASFPALAFTDVGITISWNSVLHDILFPTLFSTAMTVDNNPVLPTCEVEALFARIDGTHEQHGNDDTAICSP